MHRVYRSAEIFLQASLVALYVLTGRLTAHFFGSGGAVSFLWLIGGIAVGAVLLGGYRWVPAVIVGALLGNWLNGVSPAAAALITARHGFLVVASVWLLKREGRFDPELHTLRDYLRVLVLAVCIGGASSLLSHVAMEVFPGLAGELGVRSFTQRWAGHALGVVILLPLLLIWRRLPMDWLKPRLAGEAMLIVGLTLLVGQVVFLDWLRDTVGQVARGYWMFLFITWAAVRLGPHGAVLLIATTALQALAGAQQGLGFFANDITRTQLANYFFYMLCLSAVGMALATFFSERQRAEAELRLAASVFGNSLEGVIVCNAETVVLNVNPAFTRITGYEAGDIVGNTPRVLSSGRHPSEFYTEMYRLLAETDTWRGEIWNKRKNGEVFAEMLSIAAVRDAAGRLSHYIGVFSDISQLKVHEAELDRIAHFDPLTGIPNRRLLGDRLGQAIARARRNDKPLGVCYLDIDFFKPINDTYGHAAGDRLLIEVAERLKSVLREGDTLSRLGGDEFVLLLCDLTQAEECSVVLHRVMEAIRAPMVIEDVVVGVSASIGATLFPDDDSDADTLLRHADQAMYRAKEAGKNRFHLFDPEQDRKVQAHREQANRLRQALDQGEFILYYQPKADLATGEVIGAEALIRWQHPERGLVPPGEFLKFLSGSELEIAVGEWVIDTALTQIAAWKTMEIDLIVSVNVGADHLLHAEFVERLGAMLESHRDVAPASLELEILETAALEDTERAVQVINRCRHLGVHFSLDDFGTGYSSLAYFRTLPVDMLKIDQSFVRDMTDDPDDLGIVDSVIRLAGAFSRPVIAEGVETMDHAAMLLHLDCRLAQGYGIARPLPAARVPDWLAEWRRQAIWRDLPSRFDAHEDLALLVAARSHIAWVVKIAEFIERGGGEFQVAMESSHCAFWRWYHGGANLRYGAHSEFLQLPASHDRLHDRAAELVALVRNGEGDAARPRVGELFEAQDALVRLLDRLGQASRRTSAEASRNLVS